MFAPGTCFAEEIREMAAGTDLPLKRHGQPTKENTMTGKTVLSNAEVLAKLATAKSARNLDLTMNICHSEMVLEIPSFDAVARGEKQLRALLEVFFGLFPDYAVSLNGSTEAANGQMWALGEIKVTLTPPPGFNDFHGHKPNGRRATVPAFLLCSEQRPLRPSATRRTSGVAHPHSRTTVTGTAPATIRLSFASLDSTVTPVPAGRDLMTAPM